MANWCGLRQKRLQCPGLSSGIRGMWSSDPPVTFLSRSTCRVSRVSQYGHTVTTLHWSQHSTLVTQSQHSTLVTLPTSRWSHWSHYRLSNLTILPIPADCCWISHPKPDMEIDSLLTWMEISETSNTRNTLMLDPSVWHLVSWNLYRIDISSWEPLLSQLKRLVNCKRAINCLSFYYRDIVIL